MCYHEPENAHIERPWCLIGASSTHGMQFPPLMLQKQIWVKEHSLFWLILVSLNLLNGQLKQQNVFYCSFTVHNCYFCRCVRKLKRSVAVITAPVLLTTLLVRYLLVFHSVDCGLLHTTVMTHSHLPLQLSAHTNEGL
jgi:hypothetical protein